MVPASLLFRLKDEDLLEAPDDSAFLQSLRFSCARVNGVYPPLARIAAHPRPPKKRKPSASGTSFCDWIAGMVSAPLGPSGPPTVTTERG